MPQIPFVGPAYKARSSSFDAQVCVNLFPVLGESGAAKSVRALYGTPGTRPLMTMPQGPVQAIYTTTDGAAVIIVSGGRVYRMNNTFAITDVGAIDTIDGRVSVADNGTQAVLVTGSTGFVLDLGSNILNKISDEAFYGADYVGVLDTFLVLNRPGTNQFYITGSGTVTFDALDFASAESNAEPIVRHIVDHNELIIFKESVIEIWRASGAPDFPFARDMNASIAQGCAAAGSVAPLDNTIFWLGKNHEGGGMVWRLSGYTPQRVSTDAIEYAIQSYGDVSDAVAYSYQQEGHSFYVISFPSGDATWVYDVATQLWHQRAYLDPNSGVLGRHRSNCHAYFGGEHIVGDHLTGEVYVLDLDYYCDRADDPMPAIRAASHISKPGYGQIPHRCLQVDLETGVGTISGQGVDPVAWLDWSDDGGRTWGNQHAASLGKMGQYRVRVRWTRLGRSRDRVYRITISDPVKRVIIGAVLNPEA